MRAYLSAIDVIRAVAALVVAFDHGLLPRQLPIPFDQQILYFLKVFLSGPAAVVVFFVVSGFCIHYPNVSKDLDSRTFLIRRIIRLGVPFVFATGLAYSLDYRWFEMEFGGPAIWSLACEAVYYIAYIFFHGKLKTAVQWKRVLIATYGIAIVLAFLGRDILDYPHRNFFALVLIGLPVWLSGGYLAHAIRTSAPLEYPSWLVWPAWLVVVFGGGVAAALKVGLGVSYALTLTLYAIFVLPWLWSAVKLSVSSRVIKLFGDASYSVYLLHQPLIPPVRRWLTQAIPSAQIWMVDVLTIILVISALLAFYFVVERPSHHLSRRFSERKILVST